MTPVQGDPGSSIQQLLQALVRAFASASALADFITIGTPLVAVAGSLRLFVHRRLQSKDGQIQDLKLDIASRNETLNKVRVSLEACEGDRARLKGRLPDVVLDLFDQAVRQGDRTHAQDLIEAWMGSEGMLLSRILLLQGEWATSHSVGSYRASGLIVAESFCKGALAFQSKNVEARDLLFDVLSMTDDEGQESAPVDQAFTAFNKHRTELFDIDLLRMSDDAEQQAILDYHATHYHAALLLAQRAVNLRTEAVGRTAAVTLQAIGLEIIILAALDRTAEALPIAEELLRTYRERSDFGPTHPATLRSLLLVAQLLWKLGRTIEAFESTSTVYSLQCEHPDVGPLAPDTLNTEHWLALILQHMGRSAEALEIAEDVAEKQQQADPGSTRLAVVENRCWIATLLKDLGRTEESHSALLQLRSDLEGNLSEPGLRPWYLAVRLELAKVLLILSHDQEALVAAQEVFDEYVENPEFGPSHSQTLESQTTLAHALIQVGQLKRAIELAQDSVKKYEAHPDFGVAHIRTIASRHTTAMVLHRAGHYLEAVEICDAVFRAHLDDPSLGPLHPSALASQFLFAASLAGLGHFEAALLMINDVAEKQRKHPSLGVNHSDTRESEALIAWIGERYSPGTE